MTAPVEVLRLVERFDYNLTAYKQGKYNETQVRREFIDPLFKAMGWDIDNEQGYAEKYKDVIHEDSIKVGQATKAPDYSFRIGGYRKFFLEAKKPSVNIKHDTHPAYQLRRYCWSAKLPLSILTDFEEFAVYDGRVPPVKTDNAATARVMYFTYQDYPDRWQELVDTFSPDAIRKGAFDKFVESTKTKRGTAEFDDVFLSEIERWRDMLARNIALRNSLSQRELNYAVQLTIDRLIFLRIAEDRGIEPYEQLRGLLGKPDIYARLLDLFHRADDRYNSGLFHFQAERGRDNPDHLTPQLAIDDKIFQDIFKNLYYPDSPYVFSVLSADILGQVYEQFLGKVIRLTGAGRAKIEDKPEVKKAGGVFYTPTYIVDYIVGQTVGRLVEGQTPTQLRGRQPLRILDPSCGSGSFLLGAYQFLLDWYRDQYIADEKGPERWAKGKNPRLYQTDRGEWKLTSDERKQILISHIYGVDIDPQAVEVTKLSLLLKVLEGEDEQSLARQLTFAGFGERVLPDLAGNIKCGNSLIGPDFYTSNPTQLSMFDEEEAYRINAFDWQAEFAEIMGAGGFDAVIGNPPYVRSINLKETNPQEWNFYHSEYKTASFREWDIYLVFVEKGLSLLKNEGRLGYILPNKFINSQVGEGLRGIIATGKYLEELIHFEAFQIFQGATTYTCLMFLDKSGKENAYIARYRGSVGGTNGPCPLPQDEPKLWATSSVKLDGLGSGPWEFASELVNKLKIWPSLESIAQVFKGTGTNADKVYLLEKLQDENSLVRVYSTEANQEFLLEPTFLKPALRGRSIDRYQISGDLVLIVPYEVTAEKGRLVTENELRKNAPKTFDYLEQCKSRLDKREKGRFIGEGWYQYGRPQNLHRFDVPEKIVFPDVANRGTCYLDTKGFWLLDTVYAIVKNEDVELDLRYILGILNSPLLTHYLNETGTPLRGGYFRMKTAYLNPFPIRTIDSDNPSDKAKHDQMVSLVERMLELHRQLNEAKVPQAKTMLTRHIEATDRQIDRLVYDLYGLSEAEIRIVEGSD